MKTKQMNKWNPNDRKAANEDLSKNREMQAKELTNTFLLFCDSIFTFVGQLMSSKQANL